MASIYSIMYFQGQNTPWSVYRYNKLIARFVNQHAAKEYVMHLEDLDSLIKH